MPVLLRRILVLLVALSLAACGGAPLAEEATVPAAPALPTAAPPSRETFAPPPAPTALPPTPPSATALPAASFGSEILFLRKGALIAFDGATRKERQIADAVRDFAATPDGSQVALIRGAGRQTELWAVRRDGSALHQLTSNDRAEAGLAWSPDGSALLYGSSSTEAAYQPEWMAWSA